LSKPLRLLLVEDSETDAFLVTRHLRRDGYELVTERIETKAALIAALDRQPWDLVISDYALPDFNGLDSLIITHDKCPDIPFLILSGMIDEDAAAATIRAGAQDCILKSNLKRLTAAIERELRQAEIRRESARMERQLNESEEHFRLLTKLSPTPQLVNNERGQTEYVNDSFTATFGYKLEDIPTVDDWFRLAYPDEVYRDNVRTSWNEAREKSKLENKTLAPQEYWITCKDGSLCVVEVSAAKIGAKRLMAFNDVTGRRRIEDDLRKSYAFNQELLQNAPNPVLATDLDSSIRYVNPAFEKLTGFAREELIGLKSPYPWWPPEYVQQLKNAQVEGQNKDLNTLELNCIRKDGSRFWITTTIKPVKSDGEVEYYLSNWVDITGSKQAQAELMESRDNYGSLFDSMTQGVVYHDRESRVLTANPAALNMLGFSKAQISHSSLLETSLKFFREDGSTLPVEEHPVIVALRTGRAVKGALVGMAHPGRAGQRWLNVSAVPEFLPEDQQNPSRVFTTFMDVTERKEANDELIQAQKNLQTSLYQTRTALEGSIDVAAKVVEMKDPYTSGHQQRVASLSVAIAREMHLPEYQIAYLSLAAKVHDIGKINVPAEILSKTGKLSDLEFRLMMTHSQGGYDILSGVNYPWPLAQIILQHHERMDGSGYPNGLKGGEILLEARIIAVADTVEAMSGHRPYRPSLGMKEALAQVKEHKGLYDPGVVEACLEVIEKRGFSFDDDQGQI
jgi:PAS domain S-box-containing protein